jgi:CBS domain-containing protein
MTREVVTVGPNTSAKYAAEVMADRGFAALPVVDDELKLVGIVAEADVLRDRIRTDPRLHARRDRSEPDAPPSLLVHGVMTTAVRTVDGSDDVSDIARVFVDDGLRSVPVLDDGRLAGMVSRRDLLRTLARDDAAIRIDVLRLVEGYTGDLGDWDITITDGMVTVRRTHGAPQVDAAVEEQALRTLTSTVSGVVGVHVITAPRPATPPVDVSARPGDDR